jgi:hypothetical protein
MRPFRSRLARKLRSPRPRKPDSPRRGGSLSSRGRIPEKKRRPGAQHCGLGGITAWWSGNLRQLECGLRVPVPGHRGGGCPPGLRRGRPDWWPKRRCGNPPSLYAKLLTASGSRVRLSAFEENRSQPLCTGSHPERMRPHIWLLLRELLSCSERILEAPGSGKTSRAISAKSDEIAPAARIFRPPPPTPVSYAGHAACGAVSGSETSGLLGPRPIAYDSTLLLESRSINRIFR